MPWRFGPQIGNDNANMDDATEWSTDANEAVNLTLAPHGDSFSPDFTYPIFGEAETIYGYKNLTIDVQFSETDLRQYLNIEFSEKLPPNSGVEADNIEQTLAPFVDDGIGCCEDKLHVADRVKVSLTTRLRLMHT